MDSPLNNLSISTASSTQDPSRVRLSSISSCLITRPPVETSTLSPCLGTQAFYSTEQAVWLSLVLKASTFKLDVSLKQCFKTHNKKYSQREILRKQISLKYSYNLVLCISAS